MGIFCVECERRISGGLQAFENHLLSHDTPYYLCSEGDCIRRKFNERRSLYRHLRLHHADACESSSESSSNTSSSGNTSSSSLNSSQSDEDENRDSETSTGEEREDDSNENNENNRHIEGGENLNDNAEVNDEQVLDPNFDILLEQAAARLILDLRKKGNVTGTAISIVIQEIQRFVESIVDAAKQEIEQNLRRNNVEAHIIKDCVHQVVVKEPFKSLKTKDQQTDYFENNFGLVKRVPIFLGLRDDHKINEEGVEIPIQVPKHFQYVPVTKTLTAVLNNKVLFDLIHSEKKSTDGKMRSYLDGSAAENHPLISEYPFTIRINMHCDDFDTPNPLGAKTGIHKITEINFQIQNLPPKENARLRAVFVLAYAYREDLPEDGIGIMLEPFFLEMQQLESADGVEVNVNGRPYTLRATLVTGSADAAAAHEALGLYSPSCRRFCSTCTILKQDFHKDVLASGTLRTKQVHQQHVRELGVRSEEYMRTHYGVQRNTALWRKAPFADFPQAMIKDGMHDILKGLAPMEIKLALHEFCFVKKYFDVYHFNYRIQSFNYGPADQANKPSPNFTHDSVNNKGSYTIHQSAAQTWCLLQVFPFLVGDRVPLDNPHLKLLVLLKRIACTIFSHVVSDDETESVDNLIDNHHLLFVSLYPPSNVQDEQLEEEELENPDENEDFLEEPCVANHDEVQNEEVAASPQASPERAAAGNRRRKKKQKKIMPINKHHHLKHYKKAMKAYGPAVLYWCMRYI